MGVMRFLVHSPGRVTEEVAQRVYMSGLDRVPWPTRVHCVSEVLIVERAVSDSGNLHIPWRVGQHGEMMLSTGSLMERDRPYNLHVELARGKVNQVRTQFFDWQTIGLLAPKPFTDRLHEAVELFAVAATSQHDSVAAAEVAEKAIEVAVDAAQLLGDAFTEQALAARYRNSARLGTHLGLNLGPALPDEATSKLVRAAFNMAAVPLVWSDLESAQGNVNWARADAQVAWCQAQGMPVYGGPLLQLDPQGMPDWLYLWEGDFENINACLTEYLEQAIQRYRGKVQLWQCAARVNGGKVLSLSEVDKQRLAVRALEVVRKLDPQTPAILCFDQPWSEYMNAEEFEPPLYFADLLARAGVGLSGIGLEINLGYYPFGSAQRDMLDFNNLIDRWSLLGLPLYLFLTVPSSEQADPLARKATRPLPGAKPAGCTQGTQNLWISRFVPLLLAKPTVYGIVWNQMLDSQPHDFPHGGLFDAAGSPKSAVGTLTSLRRAHLA
jgi:hypothetical protein